MATNRHAMIRYRTIDRCLTRRNKRYWTSRELAEACREELEEYEGGGRSAPAKDTIKGDIHDMRSGMLGYQAPIVWYPKKQAYAYSDPDFSITKIPLGTADVKALRQAMRLLRQFRGFPEVKGVEQLVTKLSEALRVRPASQRDVLQLEDSMVSQGLEWLDLLYRACRDQHCLLLQYYPFNIPKGYKHKRIVSPHLLKEYNNRWFLFAFDHAEQAIRTYALDRIREAAFYRLEKFIEDYRFHPDRYFQHVIGVSVSAEREPEKVLLRANPERARYIATKPLHPTQQMVKQEEDGAVVFSLHLCHNMELENLLLSFGETVEVLQPNGLRQAIAERAAKLYRLYQ